MSVIKLGNTIPQASFWPDQRLFKKMDESRAPQKWNCLHRPLVAGCSKQISPSFPYNFRLNWNWKFEKHSEGTALRQAASSYSPSPWHKWQWHGGFAVERKFLKRFSNKSKTGLTSWIKPFRSCKVFKLLEKVEFFKEQVLDQEGRISGLEKMVSDWKNENKALQFKVDDFDGRSAII